MTEPNEKTNIHYFSTLHTHTQPPGQSESLGNYYIFELMKKRFAFHQAIYDLERYAEHLGSESIGLYCRRAHYLFSA